MKKVLTFLLLFIYAGSVTGLGFKTFYCCGKLQSVSVAYVKGDKDDCGKGCCKTQYHFFKVSDNHLLSSEISPDFKLFLNFSHLIACPESPLFSKGLHIMEPIHGPPLLSQPPAFILHCVYRI